MKIFFACPIGPENSSVRLNSDQLEKFIIAPVAKELNVEYIRADKIAAPGRITVQVTEHLGSADIVIVDLTGLNPNVMYELGVRHASRKPFILMASADQALPFDLLDFRTIFYKLDLNGAEKAKDDLRSQLIAAINGEAPILIRNIYAADDDSQPSQAKILEEILDNVRILLSKEMTTEYLGSFPSFFDNIIEHISTAQKSITIACDFPATGVFSTSDKFDNYVQQLEKRKNKHGVPIKMVVLNHSYRDRLNHLLIKYQYNEEAFDSIIDDKTLLFSTNLAALNNRYNLKINTPEQLYEQFIKIDNELLKRFMSEKIDVYEVNSFIPIYFWIIDGEKAIFSIPIFPEINHGDLDTIGASYGFATSNKNLIIALERIWNWYTSKDFSPGSVSQV